MLASIREKLLLLGDTRAFYITFLTDPKAGTTFGYCPFDALVKEISTHLNETILTVMHH